MRILRNLYIDPVAASSPTCLKRGRRVWCVFRPSGIPPAVLEELVRAWFVCTLWRLPGSLAIMGSKEVLALACLGM